MRVNPKYASPEWEQWQSETFNPEEKVRWWEDDGSGTVRMFKYTPLYSEGKEPRIEEPDVYRIEIPYLATL